MRVVLISTYEMGRQPFGLASPAAWLRQAGATVVCQDLSRSRLDREAIAAAHRFSASSRRLEKSATRWS